MRSMQAGSPIRRGSPRCGGILQPKVRNKLFPVKLRGPMVNMNFSPKEEQDHAVVNRATDDCIKCIINWPMQCLWTTRGVVRDSLGDL